MRIPTSPLLVRPAAQRIASRPARRIHSIHLRRSTPQSSERAVSRYTTQMTPPPESSPLRSPLSQTNPPPSPSQQPPPPPPPQPPKSRTFRYLTYALLLAIGYQAGAPIKAFVSPPSIPAPNTPEDAALAAFIRAKAASLPIVQSLSSNPEYTSWDAYSPIATSQTPETTSSTGDLPPPPPYNPDEPSTGPNHRKRRITTGPLASASALSYQRIFHHTPTDTFTSVVYFGPALGGWPGIIHGGATGTILDESLGRCAVRQLEGGTGVTARLELGYKRPVDAGAFYVVRCRPMFEAGLQGKEGEKGVKGEKRRKIWVEGTLESLDGTVCMTARALYVRPKGVVLRPLGERF